MLTRTIRVVALVVSVALSASLWAAELEQVIAGSHRKTEDKARDQYRHPLETLRFFGLKPDMKVVEILPIGGWYTSIVAPYLKEHGTYYAAMAPEDDNSDGGYYKQGRESFVRDFMSNKDVYGNIQLVTMTPDQSRSTMPQSTADMVLTFRNVHNWMAAGTAQQQFAGFYAALKPGGVLGVVEHRAKAEGEQDPKADSGYVQQAHVIKLATAAGFRLEAQSEINANPKDTKDYPGGVWTLPPGYANGDKDRARYAAIGESDRMTLKFVKPANAQVQNKGAFEKIKVFGPSLQGNLEKDDPNREVLVYLPPSYAADSQRRYPVVYFLHGYSVGAEFYAMQMTMPESADKAIASGGQEMIIVMPDANSVYSGSMYSNSLTTGDWEGYIAKDLVSYVDKHYRTLANRNSRGLAGHSMGGYGTMRIGMKHPEVFGALYAMSSCCLMNQAPSKQAVEQQIAAAADKNPPPATGFANVLKAQAAAWAPNPHNPPNFFDWPFVNGEAQPLVQAKWIANSPLVMVDQYVPDLQRYSAIALDVGDKDNLSADNKRLDAELSQLGVKHSFEIYEGDHTNRVGQRWLEQVLPFFSKQLVSKASK